MIFDISLKEYFKIFFFMKNEGNWNITELDSLIPFELELYYYMQIKEYKDSKGIK